MIWLNGIISLVVLLLHAENMLLHKVSLNQEATDQSRDKWFDTGRILRVVLLILLSHGLVATRHVIHGSCDALFWVGVLVFVGGYSLRTWSYRILGRLFTFEIGIRDEHKIIRTGPYRFIRHPGYTGYILMIAGVGLSTHSVSFLVIGLVVCAAFFVARIRNEEEMLAEHFGEAWEDYRKKTNRLIPFVF